MNLKIPSAVALGIFRFRNLQIRLKEERLPRKIETASRIYLEILMFSRCCFPRSGVNRGKD